MACVPLTSNKKRLTFDATVNLECLMAVPYVNAVFFTKLRLLNSRNSRQYSKRVSVVDNSVHWNSSHSFQCKAHINPETNILESCKLKISVRMESDGGKSFQKIGYVIVDLSCFVASGFVRCRRRYLLKGYDVNRRRAEKRQDNSLLVVSFTCQQTSGSTCFALPREDLSNCVSTSRSTDALDSKATPTKSTASIVATVAAAVPPTLPSGSVSVRSATAAVTATTATDLSFLPSSAVLPPLLPGGWNEDRVQIRSRRRRKEQVVKEEEEVAETSTDEFAEIPRNEDGAAAVSDGSYLLIRGGRLSPRETNRPLSELSFSTSRSAHILISNGSLGDEQVASSGGEYISPASASFEQEEEDVFSSPLQLPPSLHPTPMIQRLSKKLGGELSSASTSTSTSSSSSASNSTSTRSSSCTSSVKKLHPSTPDSPDFSSLPIPSRISIPPTSGGITGGGKSGRVGDSGGSGQFHTCPAHVRPASSLVSHQRRKMLGAADSGIHFLHGGGTSPSSTEASSSLGMVGGGGGTDLSLPTAVAAMERCSLASSGFQSHSRNSSFESAGMLRCFPAELTTTITPAGGNAGDGQLWASGGDVGGIGGSKQHLIDSTRAPHDEVVSQILRTSSAAIAAQRSTSPVSPATTAATVGETNTRSRANSELGNAALPAALTPSVHAADSKLIGECCS
ncbi:hypothetical protein Aperf_G00000050350 [Anoplocephala perfoliata]